MVKKCGVKKADYSLRERKSAKTRARLGVLFLREISKRGFSGVNIADICRKADISEATFYNYFPKKTDILCYSSGIFMLKAIWEIKNSRKKLNTLNLLVEICGKIFKSVNMRTFYEITSIMIAERVFPRDYPPLSVLERLYALPRCRGIESIKETSLEDLFFYAVKRGIKRKELPPGINPRDVVLGVLSVFIGVPLSSDFKDFGQLEKIYKKQFSLLFRGFRRRRANGK